MHAFTDCSGLTSATIGNSMTSISRLSFSGCDDPTSFTIGNSVTKQVDAAYYTPRQFLRHQSYFYHSTTCTTKEGF
ncbi:leucine-rich repeat protein [Segatella bryantii]|uniref:leucine-rich repeat protein n=1 Tax=Segatella bryantii TaxID=77095 RepID=UPI00384B8B2C